jgi:DNA-binding NarL/FixJ family response regulator
MESRMMHRMRGSELMALKVRFIIGFAHAHRQRDELDDARRMVMLAESTVARVAGTIATTRSMAEHAIAALQQHELGEGGVSTAQPAPDVIPLPHQVAAYSDGLTPREVEVLGLLAAGRSNREIAETLVVSVRTIGRHIDNIYGKIGLHDRRRAREYACERGLAAPAPGDPQ